jgi:hypothetical protein
VGAGEHNSPFKLMGVVNFAIAYTPLLDGMKNSPLFRNLVQIDLKEDAREVRMHDKAWYAGGTDTDVRTALRAHRCWMRSGRCRDRVRLSCGMRKTIGVRACALLR